MYFAIMHMLAWLSVAMISSCEGLGGALDLETLAASKADWAMSERAEAIAASSSGVMVFVAPDPLRLMIE